MEPVVRGLAVYLFLLVMFRVAGKRTMSETTNFDLALLLIISETTQQAMVDDDHSMLNGALLIMTLIMADIVLSAIKYGRPSIEQIIDGTPVIIVKDGSPLTDRMRRERVDEDDVLEAARFQLGLESLDQIKFAVLERGGKISIVPRAGAAASHSASS